MHFELKKVFAMLVLLATVLTQARAEVVLANFEGNGDKLSIDLSMTNTSLFSQVPAIVANPDPQSVNSSSHCLGAVNVSNADWWMNFVKLKLRSGIVITDDNRYLSFKAYRTIQPKMMRLGFNSYEVDGLLFQGDLLRECQWQEVVIDLGANFLRAPFMLLWVERPMMNSLSITGMPSRATQAM